MALPNRDVTITQTFDAPRALVWKAWTDPKLVAQWYGPTDFDIPFAELDLQPGGKYEFHMRGPDGTIYPDYGTYLEITPPERMVFTSCAFDDGQGSYLLETRNTLTLEEQAGRTLMTMKIVVVMGFLLVVAISFSDWSTWTEILTGFFQFGNYPVERFGVLLLDTRHRLVRARILSVGSLDASVVHPRDPMRSSQHARFK